MTGLDRAVERAFHRANLIGEGCDLWAVLCKYQAIRELPEAEMEEVYDRVAERLGFKEV